MENECINFNDTIRKRERERERTVSEGEKSKNSGEAKKSLKGKEQGR